MALPTRDQLVKGFKDGVAAGMPLSKCLDMGLTYGQTDTMRKWVTQDGPTTRMAISDGLKSGMKFCDAVKSATK